MKYDIVIVSHEKDFHKIKFVVEYADKNLDFEEIHLILSNRQSFDKKNELKDINHKIYYHNEEDILKIDKTKIRYRPNWIYQMYLKMFQNVTKNDNFLIIESDNIINKPLNFYDNGKTILYLGRNQYHKPYFNFNMKMLNLERTYNHSFISEFMMYNKNIVKDMVYKSNCNTINEFINKSYDIIDNNCYPADYELYGNFCYKYYKNDYIIKKINVSFNGRNEFNTWSYEDINKLINDNKDIDSISFHTWKNKKR